MPDPLSDLQRLGQEFDADGVEAVARAICAREANYPIGHFPDESPMRAGGVWDEYMPQQHEEWRELARAAMAAARPTIEKEAFEKAARVADEKAKYTLTDTARHAATAIRSCISRANHALSD